MKGVDWYQRYYGKHLDWCWFNVRHLRYLYASSFVITGGYFVDRRDLRPSWIRQDVVHDVPDKEVLASKKAGDSKFPFQERLLEVRSVEGFHGRGKRGVFYR